jgi:23S rRNA (adenine2503-C2)-methyltransferase
VQRSQAWAMSPEELRAAGLRASAAAVFAALQRPWRWGRERPDLPTRIWEELAALGTALPQIEQEQPSSDGSTKLRLRFPAPEQARRSLRRADAALSLGPVDDQAEAVHMPRAVGTGRVTLCVSSQVGCALGCTFCATGALGLRRQLSAGEIVAQVLVVMRALGPRHPGELTLVFMGMGEPLHNLPQVARAIRILSLPPGLGLPLRRITVSTAGLVPQIDELSRLRERPLLAVSLNAVTDELRSQLMPINRRYPLGELRAALERYPCRSKERITVEYVLLAGVNDSERDAQRLADFCAGFPHHINLIPWNAHAHAPFSTPSEANINAFARALLARRPCVLSVRRSRGQDVQGACGQLVAASDAKSLSR